MVNKVDLSDRVVGQFPLSIATSLAFEGAFGIHPDLVVKKPPIDSVTNVWVNVITLVRNIIGSLPREEGKAVRPDQIIPVLYQEMGIIEQILSERTNFKSKVTFYVSAYKEFARPYKYAIPRIPKTEIQKDLAVVVGGTITMLLKQLKEAKSDYVKYFDLKIKVGKTEPATLMLTHIAYDLLSYYSFQELYLLESHTGKVKDKSLFYTKYYNGKKLPMIPFREDLMTIFGDNELFFPMQAALRNAIIDIAEKDKWSAITSKARILQSSNKIQDPYTREVFKSILV